MPGGASNSRGPAAFGHWVAGGRWRRKAKRPAMTYRASASVSLTEFRGLTVVVLSVHHTALLRAAAEEPKTREASADQRDGSRLWRLFDGLGVLDHDAAPAAILAGR